MHGSDDCTATADYDFVKAHVDPKVFDKYERFLKIVEDPSLRECPLCKELVKPKRKKAGLDEVSSKEEEESKEKTKEEKDDIIAEMVCSKGHKFCYYHSLACKGDCAAYTIEQAKAERLANATLGNDVKPCPHCQAKIFKIEGCNHMTCGACQGHFCWTCGKALKPGADMMWHYSTSNPYGCLQLNDMDTETLNSGLTRCIRILALPGSIIGHLTFWPFAPLVFVCGLGFILTTFAIMAVQLVYYIAAFFIWLLIIKPILVLCGQEPTEAHMELFCNAPMTAWVGSLEMYSAWIGWDLEG